MASLSEELWFGAVARGYSWVSAFTGTGAPAGEGRRPGEPVALLLVHHGREHVADELGRFLEVAEHHGPVVHVDHLPVVGRHVLLELGGVVEVGLLAERLRDL